MRHDCWREKKKNITGEKKKKIKKSRCDDDNNYNFILIAARKRWQVVCLETLTLGQFRRDCDDHRRAVINIALGLMQFSSFDRHKCLFIYFFSKPNVFSTRTTIITIILTSAKRMFRTKITRINLVSLYTHVIILYSFGLFCFFFFLNMLLNRCTNVSPVKIRVSIDWLIYIDRVPILTKNQSLSLSHNIIKYPTPLWLCVTFGLKIILSYFIWIGTG